MKSVYGIKIYLTDRFTENTSIGLYAMPSPKNSQLRYITADVPNTPFSANENFKSGFITDKTNIRVSTYADVRRQGGVASSGEFSLSFDNTAKLLSTLEAAGVYINGCTAELIEFDISSQTRTIIAAGICEVQNWSETEFSIRVNDPLYKRKANIATVMTETEFPSAPENNQGKITPILYGKSEKQVFRKVAAIQEIFNTANYFDADELIPLGEDTFPVIGIRQNVSLSWIELMILRHGVGFSNSKSAQNWSTELFIRLGTSDNLTSTQFDAKYDFKGKWIYVRSGKNKGYYRQIESAYWKYAIPFVSSYEIKEDNLGVEYVDFTWSNDSFSTNNPILRIVLAEALPEVPDFNWYGTGSDNTFVQIMDLEFAYQGETEECDGFTDDDGNNVTPINTTSYVFNDKLYKSSAAVNELLTFAKVTSGYSLLSPQNLIGSTDPKNKVLVDPKYIKDDLETIYSYNYYAPKSISAISTSDLSAYVRSDDGNFAGIWSINSKVQDGIFAGLPVTVYQNPNTFSKLYNKYYTGSTNYLEWIYKPNSYNPLAFPYEHPFITIALELQLPDIPTELDFENMYLAISMDAIPLVNTGSPLPYPSIPSQTSTNIGDGYLICRTRRFWGGVEDAYFEIDDEDTSITGTKLWSQEEADGYINNNYAQLGTSNTFNNFIDAYWAETVATKNQNFWSDGGAEPTPATLYGHTRSGYTTIKIPNAKENYDAIKKVGLFIMQRANGALNHGTVIRIREVCFFFECKRQLSDEIYLPFKGRKAIGGSWISSPIDAMRDVCKRQNWSDINTTVPYGGWGKSYPDVYKVKETTDVRGSFDYTHAYTNSGITSPLLSAKFLEYDNCWTDDIKQKICRQFWLLSYTNQGYEQIDSLSSRYTTDVTESITLDKIVGDISPLTYPNKIDIFCQPFVRYAYDPNLDKYTKEIRVTNTEMSTYNADYITTIGVTVSSDDKTALWNTARTLYNKYKVINEAPAELTDLDFIEDDSTALWYLKTWMWWMDKARIKFKVPYEVGRNYYPGMRFNLTLPHHTNNVAKVCMIEKLDKELPFGKAKGLVTIDAVILI